MVLKTLNNYGNKAIVAAVLAFFVVCVSSDPRVLEVSGEPIAGATAPHFDTSETSFIAPEDNVIGTISNTGNHRGMQSDPCGTVITDRPTEMTFQMSDGLCSDAENQLPVDKYSCEDFTGEIITPACVRIFPKEKRRRTQDWRKKDETEFNAASPYFEGVVSTLDEITISPGQRFTADTTIVILDETCTVPQQEVTFHSSSSWDLFLGDGYGALRLTGVQNEDQGKLSGCTITNSPTVRFRSPATGAPVTERPTAAPSARPTYCGDTTSSFTIKSEEIFCSDLTNPRFSYLCKQTRFKQRCAITCGECECEDKEEEFEINGSPTNCSEIAVKMKYQWACNKEKFQRICPKSCGICGVTPAPTPEINLCLDTTQTFTVLGNDATCEDLVTVPKYAWTCANDKFKAKCPLICGSCSCEDTPGIVHTKSQLECTEIPTSQQYRWLCNKEKYRLELCPKSCGYCYKPPDTPPPTLPPTPVPTTCGFDTTETFQILTKDDATCSDLVNYSWACGRDKFKELCPITCGVCPCKDSNVVFIINKETVTCEDFAEAPLQYKWACNTPKYMKICPKTCGVCCEDSSDTFEVNNKSVTCSDFSKDNFKWACSKSKYMEACPKTCNACPYSTPSPTAPPSLPPTSSPTDSPSLQPTKPRCEEVDSLIKVEVGGAMRTCNEVKENDELLQFCREPNVKDLCPEACGLCECNEDENQPGCELKNKDDCFSDRIVRDDCPTLCNCGPPVRGSLIIPTNLPSTQPTPRPTPRPIPQPTSQPVLPPACFDQDTKCTSECGDLDIFNSLECQCDERYTKDSNAHKLCDRNFCPYNIECGKCDYCSYWTKYWYNYNYQSSCILARWGLTSCVNSCS